MGWVCRVCGVKAEYLCDFGTSSINKQGEFSIQRMAYCEEHKPAIFRKSTENIIKYWELKK